MPVYLIKLSELVDTFWYSQNAGEDFTQLNDKILFLVYYEM